MYLQEQKPSASSDLGTSAKELGLRSFGLLQQKKRVQEIWGETDSWPDRSFCTLQKGCISTLAWSMQSLKLES